MSHTYGKILYNNIKEYTPKWFPTIPYSQTVKPTFGISWAYFRSKGTSRILFQLKPRRQAGMESVRQRIPKELLRVANSNFWNVLHHVLFHHYSIFGRLQIQQYPPNPRPRHDQGKGTQEKAEINRRGRRGCWSRRLSCWRGRMIIDKILSYATVIAMHENNIKTSFCRECQLLWWSFS